VCVRDGVGSAIRNGEYYFPNLNNGKGIIFSQNGSTVYLTWNLTFQLLPWVKALRAGFKMLVFL
jgi:hypothetical protein